MYDECLSRPRGRGQEGAGATRRPPQRESERRRCDERKIRFFAIPSFAILPRYVCLLVFAIPSFATPPCATRDSRPVLWPLPPRPSTLRRDAWPLLRRTSGSYRDALPLNSIAHCALTLGLSYVRIGGSPRRFPSLVAYLRCRPIANTMLASLRLADRESSDASPSNSDACPFVSFASAFHRDVAARQSPTEATVEIGIATRPLAAQEPRIGAVSRRLSFAALLRLDC